MAHLIPTPTSAGLTGPFERDLLQLLLEKLPDGYGVAPNFQIKPKDRDALEIDFLVLAPHALYVLEAKEWYGRLSGDDTEWLINQTPKKPPIWLTNLKCKVLKGELGALASQVYISPLIVIPDGTTNHVGGNWGSSIRSATGTIAYLQDPNKLPRPADIRAYHAPIVTLLQGKWGARQQEKRRRIGGYEIIETLTADAASAEYLARHALLTEDRTVYRIRTFRVDPNLPKPTRDKQSAVIRRPTEAVAKIGPHPNLLRVLHFAFDDERSEFFEVTEWSDFGTLHGYLQNQERDRLTLRERLAIAEGVAAALEAVHAHGIVHRNVCPETILVGFDRRPRLTDFDRAYVDTSATVFQDTTARARNSAYVPPELSDATDYDFDTTSDMYSFGVLLHQLLLDEVPFADAAAARAAGGIPKSKLSDRRPDLSSKLDTLLLALLRVDDFKARPSAGEALAALRAEMGLSTGLAEKPSSPVAPAPVKLEPGAIVDFAWRVDAELGAGASSKVYRVYNIDHQKSYAMKVLHNAEDIDTLRHEFNHIRELLPKHDNIAHIDWLGRLADQTPYLISELVDGETLQAYCDGTKVLPWRDIQAIGVQLLDALVAIHPDPEPYERLRAASAGRDLTEEEYEEIEAARERAVVGVLHRDIKPANIMLEMPAHRPKLIDFNIAAETLKATGKGGTPRYWAPDRGIPKWKASDDLFSLGVVLYELLLHRHPYQNDTPGDGDPYHPRDIGTEFRVSDELDAFLFKAVQPSGADRFQTAREMKAALESIQAAVAPAPLPPVEPGHFPGLTVTPEEAARTNENPYVTRLLTLYSQARRSNAGTRGLDEIARLTYVETQLDRKLAPAIASGRFRLVIVTGNAGDGKTAFLQQVERLFADNHAVIEPLPTRNGSRWTHEGLSYETNYDGSQDEGEQHNDAVLDRFFAPFAGNTLSGLDGTEVRLIAVNEGRLLDFLAPRNGVDHFAGLRRFVHRALDGQAVDPRALLVNLNLRAVTAGGAASLVERQLVAMLAPVLWAPCETCAHRARCPTKHNVDTLRDEASGPATRERVRRLFEVVHLRRRAHVTMRDLRSALSYMLLRDQSCADVATLLARTDGSLTEDLSRLYYPDAFADRDAEIGCLPSPNGGAAHAPAEERTVDRLVRRLREADVGLPNAPALDRRLDHDPETAVPWMTYERRSPTAKAVMAALGRDAPSIADDVPFADLLAARRRLLARRRRWAYFERRDEGWRTMIPYRSTALLERIVVPKGDEDFAQACDELRDKVVHAISRAEGLMNEDYNRRYLALKVTQVKDAPVRSYRLFPKESFRATVARATALAEYLEHAPDTIELVSEGGQGAARLRISLDLLEMLDLIGRGYRPTANELQGLFVNLLIFRNELLTTTFDRVLVTQDDRDFYEITAEGCADGIRLALAKHETPGDTEEKTP
ncbi:methylation-associated defense system protein kinase MAD6 [Sorangium sp. So ce385]|uniref:methylation-associated defense system protein kinase MAD6 n=1 Tax=Sorangium sp. So ce385 TaxID=3133308 RepID=UPI003F5AE0DA